MLKSLYIKNYAIIDELTIDFKNGFSVFTGETGAGKSIIIGALSYLSNKRADTSIIRSGADKTIIEGVFTVNKRIKELLIKEDIDAEDELIVKRTISRDSNSTIRVNGSAVTLAFLDELLKPLIDIHSQKDSQYLLDKKNHIMLLDRYANDEGAFENYHIAYENYTALLKEYEKLLNTTYNEHDLDYIAFELSEIRSAKLDVNEEKNLEEKEKNYKSMEKYLSHLSNAVELYNGNGSIKEKLQEMIACLDIDDENIRKEKDAISNLYYELEDHYSNIESILNHYESGEINIEAIEERLFTYSKLKRKYSKTTEGLLLYAKELEDKLNSVKDREVLLQEKKEALNKAKEEVLLQGKAISDCRKKYAIKLQNEIIVQAKELLLPDIAFSIEFKEIAPEDNGIDDVEFYLSFNKGESLKPLKNIASGGEISRIMLALKIIFAHLSDTELIVFDEIDTGVSGKAALSIGEKMALIAKDLQVVAITHLSPVAACADTHYYIFKKTEQDITLTSVKTLNEEETCKELAIMSTGSLTVESLSSAIDLFKRCQKIVHEH